MKKLLITACLFVVTSVARLSFTSSAIFGQESKTAKADLSPDESVTTTVEKLFVVQ